MRPPKLLVNNNFSGKAEDIYLFIGGPSASGVRQLDRATARCWNTRRLAARARLMMLVLHDDPTREYAYGPAQGLPASKIGTFPQALYDEAKDKGLERHQHEERLEANLPIREMSRGCYGVAPAIRTNGASDVWKSEDLGRTRHLCCVTARLRREFRCERQSDHGH